MEKTCKIHGELAEQDIQIEKIKYKTKSGEIRESAQYRCRLCRRAKDMKYKHAHKDERLEYNRQWRKENKEHVNALERERRKNNPEREKELRDARREKHGKTWSLRESTRLRNITIEDYNIMFKEQNGLCAICNKPETRKSRKKGDICRLTIDHCHFTNIVRGLLCHACNVFIGHANDDIKVLEAAIDYLNKHKHLEGIHYE